MACRRLHSSWTPERDAQLCALFGAGKTGGEVGEALGISRNAALARANRLRAAGDPRAPAGRVFALPSTRRASPPRRTADPDTIRLTVLMADGCPTLMGAALRLNLSIDRVEFLWARVCRDLGPQAI